MLPVLNLPVAPLKLVRSGERIKVQCLIRNSSVILTPEEWVRQHILNYLMAHQGYPKGRIAVEYTLKYNGLFKRCDILVTDQLGAPLCIVECKAPEVSLNMNTFHQIASYDHTLKARVLTVSNGLQHFSLLKNSENKGYSLKETIVSWEELLTMFPA
jgi:hypothetical protein